MNSRPRPADNRPKHDFRRMFNYLDYTIFMEFFIDSPFDILSLLSLNFYGRLIAEAYLKKTELKLSQNIKTEILRKKLLIIVL